MSAAGYVVGSLKPPILLLLGEVELRLGKPMREKIEDAIRSDTHRMLRTGPAVRKTAKWVRACQSLAESMLADDIAVCLHHPGPLHASTVVNAPRLAVGWAVAHLLADARLKAGDCAVCGAPYMRCHDPKCPAQDMDQLAQLHRLDKLRRGDVDSPSAGGGQ